MNIKRIIQLCAISFAVISAVSARADGTAPADRDGGQPSELGSMAVQQIMPPGPEQIRAVDPFALYGGEILFDVYRKKTRVGEHRISFQREGNRLTANVSFSLAVNFLFFRAYTFEYESSEIWEDGQLIALTALTDDNGKLSNVVARAEDGVFKIDGPRGQTLASSWVFPTNHWNRGQVASTTVLNTINGRLTRVEIVRNGIDRIETAQGPVDAEHFTYTGELRDTDVWYGSDGRWVKMSFKAKDGSIIDYRCRQCGPKGPENVQSDAGDKVDAQPDLAAAK